MWNLCFKILKSNMNLFITSLLQLSSCFLESLLWPFPWLGPFYSPSQAQCWPRAGCQLLQASVLPCESVGGRWQQKSTDCCCLICCVDGQNSSLWQRHRPGGLGLLGHRRQGRTRGSNQDTVYLVRTQWIRTDVKLSRVHTCKCNKL